MTSRRILPLLPLLTLTLLASCSTFAVAAATVNGQKITEDQVESELDRVRSDPTFQDLLQRQADELRGVARRNILSGLIRQVILEQEARRRGIRVTREQIDRLIEQEAGRQGLSVEEFRKAQNLSVDDAQTIGERIVRQFELRRQVTEESRVDDAAIRQAYEAQKESFVELNLLRVTVRTEAAARDVLEELQQGATLTSLAPRVSIDELADEGGDMGWTPLTSLSNQAQTALEGVAINGVTDPIPVSGNGFEIYRLIDRRSRSLSDVRDEIRGQLGDQAREQEFEEWLGEQVRAARIVVNPKYGQFDRQALQVVPGERELRP